MQIIFMETAFYELLRGKESARRGLVFSEN